MRRTVLIVDDRAPFRRAARELLTGAGFEVIGEAADGQTGVADALRLGPAIVLLDVQLPDIDGFEVARRLDAAGHAGVTIIEARRRCGRRPCRRRPSGRRRCLVDEWPAAASPRREHDLGGDSVGGMRERW